MPSITAPPELSDRFRRQGAMIMCVVAFPWAATGIGILGNGIAYWAVLIASLAIAVALAVYSVRFTPRETRERHVPSNWQRRYVLTFVAELVLIAIAIVVLIVISFPGLIPAVIAIIVGAHFLPLANAFDQREYLSTAVELLSVGALAIVGYAIAGPQLCGIVAGLGSAVALWKASLLVTRAG